MENEEMKQMQGQFTKGHISSKNPKWLAENVEEANQIFNQILELVQQGAEKSDFSNEKKPKLITHVEDMLHKHLLLAGQYDKLQRTLGRNNALAFPTQSVGDNVVAFPYDSCFQSPNPKCANHNVDAEDPNFDVSLRSDGGSSDISGKGVSECSSLLSSDSDSESYKPSAYKISMSPIGARPIWEPSFGHIVTEIDKHLKVSDQHEILLTRISKCEEELSLSNQKLEFSEEEATRLKKELEEEKTFLEIQKKKEMELQRQVSELETQLIDSNAKIGSLEMELEVTKVRLEISEEEISNLKCGTTDETSNYIRILQNQLESAQQEVVLLEAKLGAERRQTSEMHNIIQQYAAEIADRDEEIRKLEAALQEVSEKFSVHEVQLSLISSFSEHLSLSETRAEEWEKRSKMLEIEIHQGEADKTEMSRLHEAQETRWKSDIDCLKAEINEKGGSVDALNKELDELKLKYDILVSEKDGAIAKIQTLGAELVARDNQVQQMEGHLHQLHLENLEQISTCESARKQYEDLRLRVLELEKELESQKVLILERADEKREAIRQLCLSLEHYRNGYEELRQAYAGFQAKGQCGFINPLFLCG